MIARTAIFLLFLLGFRTSQAHDPPTFPDPQHGFFGLPVFESPADSAEFMRFRAGLQWEETVTAMDSTSTSCKLVWREDQHGGLWVVSRGDGSTWPRSSGTKRIGPRHDEAHFRTVGGKHGIVITWETPCGLICRTASYYVEE